MIKELRDQLDNKEISAVELAKQYLDRIEEGNKELNAYILTTAEYAMSAAEKADAQIANGDADTLTGIPYALKDLFCVNGIETTAASNILKGYIPPYTATVAEKLGGAVMLGKGNTDEFAMGVSTETSAFGVTRNPHDPTKVAGGSSGGPAAAVAADMAVFGIGTDTGGSLRNPASFCGLVGLRPTYGRVSRYGAIAMASSLDTVGPMTKTVEDMAMVMEQIAGLDPMDSTTVDIAVPHYSKKLEEDVSGLTVGLPKEYFEIDGLHPDVVKAVENAKAELEKKGIAVKEVSLPHTKYAIPTYYIICPSEVSSTTARYDGIKYGAREDAEQIEDIYAQSRAQGFGDEVKRRIMIGAYALSAGYYDAYYLKAMKVRTLIRQDFGKVFEEVDFLLSPTTPHPAFTIGEKSNDPIQLYLEDVFTAAASLAGTPALALPFGKTDNLPLSVQLMGPQWSESLLLRVGNALEQVAP